MNIAKMFVFAALLVMAGGGGGGLVHAEDCNNAPHQGAIGEVDVEKGAFNSTQGHLTSDIFNTDGTDDAQVYHNGPHADASDPVAQLYHHGPTRG